MTASFASDWDDLPAHLQDAVDNVLADEAEAEARVVAPQLYGSRVALRPFESSDDAALYEVLQDPRLDGRRNLPYKHDPWIPPSLHSTAAIREDWGAREHFLALAVFEPASGNLVGYTAMGWGWDPLCPWVNLVVAPEHWRAGIGREVVALLMDFLFGTTVANVVSCTVDAWNEEGIAFVTAVGFQPTGRYRRDGFCNGRFYDTLTFDLLRREWLALEEARSDGA